MKRAFPVLVLMLSVALLASGCDFLRSLAGRPTSAQIEAKAEAIAADKAAREQARLDSIAAARKHEADSIAAMDSLAKEGRKIMGPERYGGLTVAELSAKYYIIVGAFSNLGNAQRYSQRFTDKGYPAEIIAFKNGYNVVGVCKTNNIAEAYKSLKELRKLPFCPPQVWILSND